MTLRLLIAVPSYSRAELIGRMCLSYLPIMETDWRIFVEPQEYEAYARVCGPAKLVPLAEGHRGLGYSKASIAEYATANGYALIFKLDDDITHWSPGFGSSAENKRDTPALLNQAIVDSIALFEQQPLVKGVGFNYSQFMHRKKSDDSMWTFGTRLQTAYIIRTEDIAPHPEFSMWEDFYTTLSVWVNGGYTARYLRAGMATQPIGHGAGGMQASGDRSLEVSLAVSRMRKLFPMLRLRDVDRPWKVEPDMRAASRYLFPKVQPSHQNED